MVLIALNLLCREYYTEKCVMNNYFGIGLDAKISLDFNNKRDEHPEKCRWVTPVSTPVLHVFLISPLEGKVLKKMAAAPLRPARFLFLFLPPPPSIGSYQSTEGEKR